MSNRSNRSNHPILFSGEQVIAEIAGQTDTILLAFSCGKDSIVSWLACRPHFRQIIPYYMYLVPGLEFVEESVCYYERFFGERIMRIPHPSLYRMLANYVFQPPERCATIAAARLPQFDYHEIQQALREDMGLADTAYVANGVRAVDSPQRMMALKRFGAISHKKKQFYPVWDWKKARLIEELQRVKVKLPIDYRLFGRSFDGIDYRFLAPIKKHFPRDYARILEWFPLADLELKRREYASAA